MMVTLFLKTWVGPKTRKLASGNVVQVAGYYDPRSPKRPYAPKDGEYVGLEGSRKNWLIPIVKVSEIVGQAGSAKERRATVSAYARTQIKGVYRNHEGGFSISVGRNAIDKCLSHGIDSDHFNAISAIPDLLLHGTFYSIAQPKKEKHRGAESFLYAMAPLSFGVFIRVARVVIKVSQDNYVFYDFDLSKKVDDSDVTTRNKRVAVTESEPSNANITTRSGRKHGDAIALSMSIADMEKYINTDGGIMKKSMFLLFENFNLP
jgi:hypothetical protein